MWVHKRGGRVTRPQAAVMVSTLLCLLCLLGAGQCGTWADPPPLVRHGAFGLEPPPCPCSHPQVFYSVLADANSLSVGAMPNYTIAYMTTGWHLPDPELDRRFAEPHVDNR